MEFIINGTPYKVTNLSEGMDSAFLELHAGFLGFKTISIDQFYNDANEFFNNFVDNYSKHDDYFRNFTIIWENFLKSNNILKAENIWKIALKPAIEWEEKNPGKTIHKGSAFYFWGMTSVINKEIDKGYLLMHKALQEDERTYKTVSKGGKSPSLSFAILDVDDTNQYFYEWVKGLADYLEKYIEDFNRSHQKNLNFKKFIDSMKNNNSETIYLFAYTLARIYNISKIPEYVIKNGFSSQLEMNLLFDLTLIIDSNIKIISTGTQTFIDKAEELSQKAGLNLDRADLRDINDEKNIDFELTIKEMLNLSFNKLRSGKNINIFESDLAIAYCIRNKGAHSTDGCPIIFEKFEELKKSLFSVLFLIADIKW
jgi:hypothetical protein